MKLRALLVFTVLFAIIGVLSAMLWHWQMAGSYFISKERGIIVDFLPPFVHPGVNGEIFLKPVRVVYAIWSLYVAAAIALPAIGSWLFTKLYEKDLERAWR